MKSIYYGIPDSSGTYLVVVSKKNENFIRKYKLNSTINYEEFRYS